MTEKQVRAAFRRDEAVFFRWNGRLSASPIVKVNQRTVTLVTSSGERNIAFEKVEAGND